MIYTSTSTKVTDPAPQSNISEEPLFPTITKDTIINDMGGFVNTPDYQLQKHHGVGNSFLEMPAISDGIGMNVFNRYYKIFPDDESTAVLNYIFMVRPDLNMDYCVMNDPYYTDLILSHPRVALSLTQTLGKSLQSYANKFPSHHFVPWLVPRTVNNQLPDFQLKSYDYEQPFTNFHTGYAGNGNDSRSGTSMSLTFRETKHMEVTRLFDAWVKYIDGINLGYYSPRGKYVNSKITNGAVILDYATSIYQIGVLPDGAEIVFFHKTTGLYPTEVPISSWAHDGRPQENNQISITFSGGFPESFDPAILADFNYNAGMHNLQAVSSTAEFSDPLVGTPFVTYNTRTRKYYLRWRQI